MTKSSVAVLTPSSSFLGPAFDSGDRVAIGEEETDQTDAMAIPILHTTTSGMVGSSGGGGGAAVARNGDLLIAYAVEEDKQATAMWRTEQAEDGGNAQVLESGDLLNSGDAGFDPSSSRICGSSDTQAGPGIRKETTKPTFVMRMVRELSFKREVNAKIAKTQLQLKKMQLLMNGYQGELQRALGQLKNEAADLEERSCDIHQTMKMNVSRMTSDGFSRQFVSTYRSFQLLLLQENKLLKAQTALRQMILQTRIDECDWMCKSVSENYQQRVNLLSAQLSTGESDASNQLLALCAEETHLSADDPFFANADHLYQSHAQNKQLDLQLSSIAKLLVTMRGKVESFAKVAGEGDELASSLSAQAPFIVKRSSFKESANGDSSAMSAKKKEIRRILFGVSKLIEVQHGDLADLRVEDLALFNEHLSAFARAVSDKRTRTGRLLLAFAKKLADEAQVDVQITPCTESFSPSIESATAKPSGSVEDGNFYISNLQLLQPTKTKANGDGNDGGMETQDSEVCPAVVAAIDANALPPPISILAFARFIQKLIVSEYDLAKAVDDVPVEANESSGNGSVCAVGDERPLEACVHHVVFSRLSKICFAYEQSQYCAQEEQEGVATNPLHTSVNLRHLRDQHYHWKHSKRAIQQVSLEALAFPRDASRKILEHLEKHQHTFLPQALRAFKGVECEVTPRGVVRAVMIGFGVLHRELVRLLYTDRNGVVSSFLNADVLIPSLVLMMSRLNDANELDLLWRRLNLVRTFQAALLSQGCEEAYYLTCLQAAMEFIQTFSSDPRGTQVSLTSTRNSCEACKHVARQISLERYCPESTTATKAQSGVKARKVSSNPALPHNSSPTAAPSVSDEETIQNLSTWISKQPSVECIPDVIAHEVWVYEGSA